jgi:hypothetical protein
LVRPGYEWPGGPLGLPPLLKPPYGRLVAIDLNKAELKWTVANVSLAGKQYIISLADSVILESANGARARLDPDLGT